MFKRIVESIRPSKPQFINRISIEYGGILAQTNCKSILFFLHPNMEWGGGLNHAILEMAGPELGVYVRQHVTTPRSGEVFALPPFKAPYKQMFVAILGHWDGGNGFEDRDLLNCYRHTIRIAQELGLKSIAIPAMGRDKRDFPHIRFARLALKGINETLDDRLEFVKIYCADRRTYNTYAEQITRLNQG